MALCLGVQKDGFLLHQKKLIAEKKYSATEKVLVGNLINCPVLSDHRPVKCR